ncbi:sensor histidine kinase [Ornithinimicrobium humiphilum]|uniref:histidine kinase n=1 Tax=Ornithinimicrobium humiphilum TaxID=125288 RepID=A0A543KMT5_9MICO|nr:sensor histidine kinase [Ornithinimicrobium humiphilum]TQM96390.1 signal transduction histidine kinase [Ornithinimicrobium humiphilum]
MISTDTPPPLPGLPGREPDDLDDLHDRAPATTTDGPERTRSAARRTVREAAYLIVCFPVAVWTFVVAVVGLSGAAALVTAPLFVPLAGVLLRASATIERSLQRQLLGRRVPQPVYASDFPTTGSAAGNVWRRVTDPQTWLEIVWGIVGFVVATVTFVLTVTFGAIAVAGLTSPLWFWIIVRIPEYAGLGDLLGIGPGFVVDSAANVLAGLVGLALLVPTTRLGSMLQSGIAGALIGTRATEERYAAIARAHTAGQQAERDSLRRLERDLHDGPQQGLVRLQMDLARAERLMETDPQKAREILAGAGLTASSTLGELRALSRGIAPPELVDHGLHSALMSLAASHPARVTIHDRIGTRLPEQVETALYYAVSEALTNVAKHARARTVEVILQRRPGWAEAVVTDDGVGGASIAKGHGLAGLERRLAGVQGTLWLSSPEGGPTTLVAAVPSGTAR